MWPGYGRGASPGESCLCCVGGVSHRGDEWSRYVSPCCSRRKLSRFCDLFSSECARTKHGLGSSIHMNEVEHEHVTSFLRWVIFLPPTASSIHLATAFQPERGEHRRKTSEKGYGGCNYSCRLAGWPPAGVQPSRFQLCFPCIHRTLPHCLQQLESCLR